MKAQDPAEDIDLNEKYQTFMTQVKAIADDYREFDQTQSTLQGTIVDKQTQAFDYLLDQKQRKFDESMTATPQLDSLFNTLYQDMIVINEINLKYIRDDALEPLSKEYIKFYNTSTQRILKTAQDQVSVTCGSLIQAEKYEKKSTQLPILKQNIKIFKHYMKR